MELAKTKGKISREKVLRTDLPAGRQGAEKISKDASWKDATSLVLKGRSSFNLRRQPEVGVTPHMQAPTGRYPTCSIRRKKLLPVVYPEYYVIYKFLCSIWFCNAPLGLKRYGWHCCLRLTPEVMDITSLRDYCLLSALSVNKRGSYFRVDCAFILTFIIFSFHVIHNSMTMH